MAHGPDYDRYVAACTYPGRIDPEAVADYLREYCRALGIERDIVQLRRGWTLADYPALDRYVDRVLDDFAQRQKQAALAAQAAQDAQAARDAQAAQDALAALDARDARDAQDAQDALAALAAQAARAARDAQDALAARAARAAQDALAARAARDALDAQAAARHRFAAWCMARWGWWWYGDLSYEATVYLGALQAHSLPDLPWARPLFEAFVAGAWLLHWTDDTLYWVAKPAVRVEPAQNWRNRRLHCDDGPACDSDIEPLYFIHGVLVTEQIVMAPETLTAAEITAEPNAEVRRVMLERHGQDRYIRESGAQVIHRDDFGTLYRAELLDDEPLVMVKVLNATPEPDGSYHDFFLRVPPTMRTALEAVAWTFDMQPDEYARALVAQT